MSREGNSQEGNRMLPAGSFLLWAGSSNPLSFKPGLSFTTVDSRFRLHHRLLTADSQVDEVEVFDPAKGRL